MKKFLFLIILMQYLNLFSNENISPDNNYMTISIDDAVSLSLKNNFNIENEEFNLKDKKWSMITSWNIFLPETSLGVEFSKKNEKYGSNLKIIGPIFGSAYGVIPEEYPDWGLSATFDLYFSFNSEMVFNVYKTVLDWKYGKLNLKKAEQIVIKDTKKYFYNLYLLQETISVFDENLKASENRYKEALKKYDRGIISRYDFLSAQVSFENMKPAFINLKKDYLLLILKFKKMIGIKDEVEINLIPSNNENIELNIITDKNFNSNVLITNYLNNQPEMQILKMELESIQNNRNIYISRLTPSFFMEYFMDPTFQKDAMSDRWFGDSEYNKMNWRQINGGFFLGFKMSLTNLFPFSSEQVNIINAQNKIQQKLAEIDNYKKNFELEIKELAANLNILKDTYKKMQSNLELANESYKLADTGYRIGGNSILEVEKAEKDLTNAKLNLLNEKYKYLINLIDLEYTLNTRLETLKDSL